MCDIGETSINIIYGRRDRMTKVCYSCNCVISSENNSVEHIIPNSLGENGFILY